MQVTCNCDFRKEQKEGRQEKQNKTTTNVNWKEKKVGRKIRQGGGKVRRLVESFVPHLQSSMREDEQAPANAINYAQF